jgi:hypothetical protein
VERSTLAARPVGVLLVSLGIGIGLGIVGGLIYALLAEKVILYGIATVWLVIGLVALSLGLMGALEPQEGWATGIGKGRGWKEVPKEGRRSLLGRVAEEATDTRVSSLALALWAIVVGGGLIGLAMLGFLLSGAD